MQSHHLYSDGADIEDQASLEAGKLTMSYVYTNEGSQPTTKVTQIGAQASHFSGLVTVEDNLHVQGVLRIAPAGNLSMGAYTQGPTPVVAP